MIFLKAWWSRCKLARLTGNRRRVAEAVLSIDEANGRLERSRRRLKKLQGRLSVLTEIVEKDLESAERSQRQVEHAMDALREEIQIYEEHTVPTLVAQHKLLLSRHEAERAVAVRSQTLAQLPGGEEQ